ncbi:MAG: universal stress protein [Pseudomonadota bacterium]
MTEIILAPIDLTEMQTSEQVLETAVQLTQMRSGNMVALTVVPDIVAGIDFRYAIRGETGGSAALNMDQVVADALARLNEVVEQHTPDGMKVRTIARHGPIYEEILDVAKDIGATQIVMGAHNPGLADFMLGSNTDRVLRHASCSVSVVRN